MIINSKVIKNKRSIKHSLLPYMLLWTLSVAGYVYHIRKWFNMADSYITFALTLYIHERVESTSRSLAVLHSYKWFVKGKC